MFSTAASCSHFQLEMPKLVPFPRWKRWAAVGAGWVALILGTQFVHCLRFWMVSFIHFHSLGIICCHCSGSKLILWAGLHRCINKHVNSWEVLGWYGQVVLFSYIDKFWIGVLNSVEIFPVENTVGLVCQVRLCFMRLGGFFSSRFKVCDSLHCGWCSIIEF